MDYYHSVQRQYSLRVWLIGAHPTNALSGKLEMPTGFHCNERDQRLIFYGNIWRLHTGDGLFRTRLVAQNVHGRDQEEHTAQHLDERCREQRVLQRPEIVLHVVVVRVIGRSGAQRCLYRFGYLPMGGDGYCG